VPDGEHWRVVLADGEISGATLVVALGPWSAEILRPLGYAFRSPLSWLTIVIQAEPGASVAASDL